MGFLLKGLQYKGTIRVPLKGSIKGLEFPKIRGTLLWGPYNKDPTIQSTILGSPFFGNPALALGFRVRRITQKIRVYGLAPPADKAFLHRHPSAPREGFDLCLTLN